MKFYFLYENWKGTIRILIFFLWFWIKNVLRNYAVEQLLMKQFLNFLEKLVPDSCGLCQSLFSFLCFHHPTCPVRRTLNYSFMFMSIATIRNTPAAGSWNFFYLVFYTGNKCNLSRCFLERKFGNLTSIKDRSIWKVCSHHSLLRICHCSKWAWLQIHSYLTLHFVQQASRETANLGTNSNRAYISFFFLSFFNRILGLKKHFYLML